MNGEPQHTSAQTKQLSTIVSHFQLPVTRWDQYSIKIPIISSHNIFIPLILLLFCNSESAVCGNFKELSQSCPAVIAIVIKLTQYKLKQYSPAQWGTLQWKTELEFATDGKDNIELSESMQTLT